MKNLLPLLSIALLGTSNLLQAQDIDNNDIRFNYIQLPAQPVDKTIKNYQSTVVLKYMEGVKNSQLSFQEQVAKAEADYKAAMENYYVQQKLADDQYNKEMEAWDKKPLAQKILLEKEKPQKKYIPVPTKQTLVEPKYQKQFDVNLLASKYFKVEGYKQGAENPLKVTAFFLGFEATEAVLKEKSNVVKTTGKPDQTVIKYRYELNYKHPSGYRIETNAGVIFEDYPAVTTDYNTYSTAEYNSVAELNTFWNSAKEGVINQLQEKIINQNCQTLSNIINNQFGYQNVAYSTLLSTVDEEKGYEDYKQAYDIAAKGYSMLAEDLNKSNAIAKLKEAIAIWEKAMTESNPKNKKARVDMDVTQVTVLNLIEAYIFIDDFANAQSYIDKLKTLDPSKKERRRMERMEYLLKEQKKRYDANKL